MKSTYIKLGIGLLLFITWLGLVVFKTENADDIITAIKLTLAGLGAYHLNDRSNGPPPAGGATLSDKQAGFARPLLLLVMSCLSLVACLAMSGCGTINAYTSATLNAQQADYAGAKKNAQAISDAAFKAWTDSACTLPLGALQRNDTGNPNAPAAAMAACPAANAGVSVAGGAPAATTSPVPVVPTK